MRHIICWIFWRMVKCCIISEESDVVGGLFYNIMREDVVEGGWKDCTLWDSVFDFLSFWQLTFNKNWEKTLPFLLVSVKIRVWPFCTGGRCAKLCRKLFQRPEKLCLLTFWKSLFLTHIFFCCFYYVDELVRCWSAGTKATLFIWNDVLSYRWSLILCSSTLSKILLIDTVSRVNILLLCELKNQSFSSPRYKEKHFNKKLRLRIPDLLVVFAWKSDHPSRRNRQMLKWKKSWKIMRLLWKN